MTSLITVNKVKYFQACRNCITLYKFYNAICFRIILLLFDGRLHSNFCPYFLVEWPIFTLEYN